MRAPTQRTKYLSMEDSPLMCLETSPGEAGEGTGSINDDSQSEMVQVKEEEEAGGTSKVEEPQEVELEENSTYFFETDHLALKNSPEYHKLLKTLAVLEAQRIQAVQDLDLLLEVREGALKDPLGFVEKLQRGEDMKLPKPQIIAEVPNIDWSKYNLALPSGPQRPTTRTSLNRGHEANTRERDQGKPSFYMPAASSKDACSATEEHQGAKVQVNQHGQMLVRGRVYNESKPETFNQPWTAEEQHRLEELLLEFPPEEIEMRRWKKIAKALGNRSAIQVQSRVQKYFLKLQKAGLPVPGRIPSSHSRVLGLKKGQHRHQRYNHMLYRHSTFFPSNTPPVYMSEADEEHSSDSCTLSFNNEKEVEPEAEDEISDEEGVSEELKTTAEYQELMWLKRVQREKDKDMYEEVPAHSGYKCDHCNCEPIAGTRWHCIDCPQEVSVDFCNDCILANHQTEHHLGSHKLKPFRRTSSGAVWDRDYMSSRSQNYLDPNFMPAT